MSQNPPLLTVGHAQIDELNTRARAHTDVDVAYTLALEAATLAQQTTPRYLRGWAEALLTLASSEERQGQYRDSLRDVNHALTLFQELQLSPFVASCFYILTWNYYGLGDYPRAMEFALHHLQLAEISDDLKAQAEAHNSLGAIYSMILETNGDALQKSLDHYQLSLSIYVRLGEVKRQAVLLNNLCVSYQYMKRYSEALSHALQSLDLSRQSEDIYSEILVLGNLAIIERYLNNYAQALEYHTLRLHMIRSYGYGSLEAHTLLNLGCVYVDIADFDKAQEAITQALQLSETFGYRKWIYECHEQLAIIAEKQGDFERALTHYKAYHEIEYTLLNEQSRTAVEKLKIAYDTDRIQTELTRERERRASDQEAFERLNRLKDEIINTASHDLKSPLSSLLLNGQMLQRLTKTSDERVQSLTQRIITETLRMRDLIHQLLDKAQLEIGHSLLEETVVLPDFIQQRISDQETLAAHKDIQVIFVCPFLYVRFDQRRIRQVFDNLLSNAIKYTPAGGKITIGAAVGAESDLILTLQDTGIGIPATALPNLFKPFYRVDLPHHRAQEGSGLGLSIVQTIIHQHGGMIAVDSTETVGTTFTITLPGTVIQQASAPDTLRGTSG